MTTLTLWLLVSLGMDHHQNRRPVVVVERFATVEECQRVKKVLSEDNYHTGVMRCVQATVVIGAGVQR